MLSGNSSGRVNPNPFAVRFIHKYRKHKGCDRDVAQAKWDAYLRDQSIKRMYDDDGLVMLAAPITGTAFESFGTRIGDKRSMATAKKINAGDADAILEERASFLV